MHFSKQNFPPYEHINFFFWFIHPPFIFRIFIYPSFISFYFKILLSILIFTCSL